MKIYNPIKSEDKIMNEPLSKTEREFIDSIDLKALNELEALTPPTVEEMCEAFTSWIKEQGKYASMFISVEYNEKTKTFWIKKTYGEFHYLSTLDGMGQLDIANNHYPTHLITLIGRFYEGLEK